jgi:adenylylsulfate kinase
MIILFYGQPASGKTTLADALVNQSDFRIDYYWNENFVRIDGDKWRDVTDNQDYSKEGRISNLKGAFNMALYLELEGFTPILSFVTPYEELRQYLQNKSENLIQIYLDYNTDRGRSMNFSNEFEIPKTKNLHLNTSDLNINDCLYKINKYIQNNKNI